TNRPCNGRSHAPTLVRLFPGGWQEHGHVCFVAGTWKGCRHVGRATARFLNPDNQHVFCQPPLFAGHIATQAERKTLFAEQRIATISRTNRPDEALFGEMHDETALRTEIPERVQAFDVVIRCAKTSERRLPHTGNDT